MHVNQADNERLIIELLGLGSVFCLAADSEWLPNFELPTHPEVRCKLKVSSKVDIIFEDANLLVRDDDIEQ